GGFIYTGDDRGNFLRVRDPGLTPPAGADVSSYSVCGAACGGSEWAISNVAAADVVLGRIYLLVNGTGFEFPTGAGGWSPIAQASLFTPAGTRALASPTLDYMTGHLYAGYYNALFRVPYPLGGGPAVGTLLLGTTVGRVDFPRSSPLVYQSKVYLGE